MNCGMNHGSVWSDAEITALIFLQWKAFIVAGLVAY